MAIRCRRSRAFVRRATGPMGGAPEAVDVQARTEAALRRASLRVAAGRHGLCPRQLGRSGIHVRRRRDGRRLAVPPRRRGAGRRRRPVDHRQRCHAASGAGGRVQCRRVRRAAAFHLRQWGHRSGRAMRRRQRDVRRRMLVDLSDRAWTLLSGARPAVSADSPVWKRQARPWRDVRRRQSRLP
jgi:hypothetical protein